jgi:hypothetical protein
MLPYHIYVGLRQSVDANLVVGSPYVLGFISQKFGNFQIRKISTLDIIKYNN